ncbi:hypothetical protein BDV3_005235 [Batrachochytrium dendrobatidis]
MKLLFEETPIDAPDPLGQELIRHATYLSEILAGITENNWASVLHEKSLTDYEQVAGGLLHGILTNEIQFERYFQLLAFVVRDGFATVIHKLKYVSETDKFKMLNRFAQKQSIWLLDKLLTTLPMTEQLSYIILRFMRQIKHGNCSKDNIAYTKFIVDFLTSKRAIIAKDKVLARHVVFMLVRAIADHLHHLDLRTKEMALFFSLISSNIQDCVYIGRDFIRSLMEISKIPSIAKLLLSIMQSPSPEYPNIPSLSDFLDRPTPREFLISRLTPDMEIRIVFILNSVPKRLSFTFIEQFRKRFLTLESETLLPDIIRYICGAIHPNNAILASDIVQRWHLISILLRGIKAPACAQSCKLSLYFDWLFFNHASDSVMSLEPGILVMVKNLQTSPAISATMLEFLALIADRFLPTLSAHIYHNLKLSMSIVVEKRVITSLSLILLSPQLDEFTKETVTKLFASDDDALIANTSIDHEPFISVDNSSLNDTDESQITSDPYLESITTQQFDQSYNGDLFDAANKPSAQEFSAVSDPASLNLNTAFTEYQPDFAHVAEINTDSMSNSLEDADLASSTCIRTKDIDMYAILETLESQISNPDPISDSKKPTIEICQQFLESFNSQATESSYDTIASSLLRVLHNDLIEFWQNCPATVSYAQTLFTLMIDQYHASTLSKESIQCVGFATHLASLDPIISSIFCVIEMEKLDSSSDWIKCSFWKSAFGDFDLVFMLKMIFDVSLEWFYRVIPRVLRQFDDVLVGNPDLIFMVVSMIDSKKLVALKIALYANQAALFGSKLEPCLAAMCTWSAIEQWTAWNLLSEEIGVEPADSPQQLCMLASVFALLQCLDTPEIQSGVLMCTAQVAPSESLLRYLITPLFKPDLFCTIWTRWYLRFGKDRMRTALTSAIDLCNRQANTTDSLASFPDHSNPMQHTTLVHTNLLNASAPDPEFLNQLQHNIAIKSKLLQNHANISTSVLTDYIEQIRTRMKSVASVKNILDFFTEVIA